MRKLTKKNLDELAGMMPRISEIEKMSIVGGGSGTKEDPYTIDEFDSMCDNDNWKGGFVVGQGYVAGQVTVVGSGSSESSDGSGSNSGNWGDLFPGGNTTPSGYWNTPDSSGNSTSGNCSGGMWVSGVWVEDPNNNQNDNGNTSGGAISGGGISSGDGNQNNKYRETWQKNKSFYYKMAAFLGVDLNAVQIEVGIIGAAYAGSNGSKIIIGYNFFQQLSNENDRVTVLIHEMFHVLYDTPYNVGDKKAIQGDLVANINEAPGFVKEYADMYLDKDGVQKLIDRKEEYGDFISYAELKPPTAYENELKTYKKEIEYCPDSFVSKEYALERKYKIWKYELLLEKSKEVFNK